MHAFLRSMWLRQGVIIVVAELLGYLLSIELHDRYPQAICFGAVFFVITVIDEWQARRKARRARTRIETAHRSNIAPHAAVPRTDYSTSRESANCAAIPRERPNRGAAVIVPLRRPGV
jgi:hypothetical protein